MKQMTREERIETVMRQVRASAAKAEALIEDEEYQRAGEALAGGIASLGMGLLHKLDAEDCDAT